MEYIPPIGASDSNEHYITGNPATGLQGSRVSGAAIEHGMREIVNCISGAGLVPDGSQVNQLSQAFQLLVGGYVGQIYEFTTPILPTGFPGFICNGSTVIDGKLDFPLLAHSGSAWITVTGNDMTIHDSPDFNRGQGSSGIALGAQFDDQARINEGQIGYPNPYNVAGNAEGFATSIHTRAQGSQGVFYGPTETFPKNKIVLRAIYHGELI